MIRILGRSTSGNVQKVLFFLEEVGLKYTREDYGRQFSNTNTDSYRKLNPNMKVPTLVDGDLVAWESHTILRYLAALHAPHLTGATPAERTHVERWMDWQLSSFNGPYLGVFREAKKKEEERAPSFGADAKELAAQLEILEKGTAGRPWLAGESFSIADICLGPIIDRTLAFPVTLPAIPGVRAWRDKLVARDAYRRSKG